IGNSWIFEDDFVMVKAKDLKRLESEAHKVAPAVAAEIRKICYMDVVQMLVLYPEYTQRLAERLEKQIAPFDIECPEEIKVDPERYQAFFRSLVHVFRNMVDHGIESQEERSAASKDLSGTIRCLVSKLENGFKITITDDGRGIDIDKLKERAVQQGLITPEKALKMPFSQSLELVFLNGLTTARHPNGISGRGFGLAVLKEETERLGGTIEISTKPGEGTCFVFQFTDEPSQSKFNI
ncbi:MAG TPA: ATP-binding protein, partial [Bacillota bacterium]|nr:ATP-binding protein [Bacillota bacterium]